MSISLLDSHWSWSKSNQGSPAQRCVLFVVSMVFNTQCNRQVNEAQPSCYWSSTPVYHKASPSPGACLTGAISQGAGTVDVLTVDGIMSSPPSKRGHASKEQEETCLWMFPLCSPGSSQSVTPLHAQDHLPEQRWWRQWCRSPHCRYAIEDEHRGPEREFELFPPQRTDAHLLRRPIWSHQKLGVPYTMSECVCS